MKHNAVKHDLFAFFLSFSPKKEPSEITFGFYDPNRFVKNSLRWHKVTHPVFFAIKLQDVKIAGKSLGLCKTKNCTVTPDSGTSLMSFPAWATDKLKAEKNKYF